VAVVPAKKSSPFSSPLKFLADVRAEAARVSWPSRQETLRLTAFVFVMAVTTAIFFFFVDWVIGLAVRTLFTSSGLH